MAKMTEEKIREIVRDEVMKVIQNVTVEATSEAICAVVDQRLIMMKDDVVGGMAESFMEEMSSAIMQAVAAGLRAGRGTDEIEEGLGEIMGKYNRNRKAN